MITGSRPDDLREIVRALGGTRGRRQADRAQPAHRAAVDHHVPARSGSAPPGRRAAGAEHRLRPGPHAPGKGGERIADTRRATLLRNNGARMRGSATAGPVSAGGTRLYRKNRVWNHAVGSDTMTATFDAYVDGGEEAAFGAFNDSFGQEYGDGGAMFDEWLFTDMNGLEFGPDTGS